MKHFHDVVLSPEGKRVADPCAVPNCPVSNPQSYPKMWPHVVKQQGADTVRLATQIKVTPTSRSWRIRFLVGVPREYSFVTTAYAAEVLGISRYELYSRISVGTIPARLIESVSGSWIYVIPRDEFLDVVTAPA